MINEQLNFRTEDSNGSLFIVEERLNYNDNTTNYRIGVERRGEKVAYFYATGEEYEVFIQSEAKRLNLL